MFIANSDKVKVTLDRNYWHDMSGRSPKLGDEGATTTVQVTNNYNNLGHDFDTYRSTTALIEGNRMDKVTKPMTTNSNSVTTIYNIQDAAPQSACATLLGRNCVTNSVTKNGAWPSLKQTAALSMMAKVRANLVTPIAIGNVMSTVVNGAGMGEI